MPKRLLMLLLSVLVAVSLIPLPVEGTNHLLKKDKSKEPEEATKVRVAEAYGKLPLHFEANQGQVDENVRFLSRGNGYQLFLTSTEVVLSLRKPNGDLGKEGKERGVSETNTLRMKWEGAKQDSKIEGMDDLEGKSHYFIGSDPEKWRKDIPLYRKVKYNDIYPGIDLVYYGNQRQLEYDLVVKPGGHTGAIYLSIEGAEGARIDERGNLILKMAGGEIVQHKPLIYQEVEGKKQSIKGGYVVDSLGKDGDKRKVLIGFKVDKFDTKKPLIIDPVVTYSTYFGSSLRDYGRGIAVDSSGSAYVTGYSTDQNNANSNIFVAKLNPAGSALVYSTYFGGSRSDAGYSIAVDSSGSAYITGYTKSTDFPTVNPIQETHLGGYNSDDAFVSKLNPAGSALVYSTYLGGSDNDVGNGIAVDSSGSAYVTGYTISANFPAVNPVQASNAGGYDAFIVKLNPAGSAFIYSTYLGGRGNDAGDSIAVDSLGNAYVTGYTISPNFPTVNPIQGAHAGGYDAFVAKINPAGSALLYSTYLGGNGEDVGYGIAVESSGSAYIAGSTKSTNFPTVNPMQGSNAGGTDVFVSKLNSAGSALVYSTYLGGSGDDLGYAIAVDSSGSAHITGETRSANFPIVDPIQASFLGGFRDAFVARLNPAGSALLYSTYFGGSGDEAGNGIAVDNLGGAYITGYTGSTIPLVNPIQPLGAGYYDAFVTKLDSNITGETISTPTTPTGPSSGTINVSYSYSTSGSISSSGHPVEYQFDWKGDGSDLSPWGSATQSRTWNTTGTRNVRARARCTTDTFVISSWSGSLVVNIDVVSKPTTLSGPTAGVAGAPYSYTTGGSISSLGHPVEYQFDWKGDGSDLSPWDSVTQTKIWTAPGTYSVRSRARCTVDTTVISAWFAGVSVTISTSGETVSTPTMPTGITAGIVDNPYSYSTGGSISNLGHPVEYQFDWKGDGSDLSPWGSATQTKSWTSPGVYNVQARARCTIDTNVISAWSGVLTVTIAYGGKGVINLPWTGQQKCFDSAGVEIPCEGTGQDGELQEGVGWPSPRFSVIGDCVTDNLTGLMWSRNANLPGGTTTWQGALDYVALINSSSGICGHKDWRLPNLNELESLVNMGVADPASSALWLNSQGFLNVKGEFYWSSTMDASVNDLRVAWKVHTIGETARVNNPETNFLWPVRAGQMDNPDPLYPANISKTGQTISYASADDGDLERGVSWPTPRFTDHGDGTVTDKLTGLMWSKNADIPNNVLLWQEALDYVKSANSGTGLGGYHDWRLPNARELLSLADRSKYNPALPAGHPFENVRAYWYWSSSTYARVTYTYFAWRVFMVDGNLDLGVKATAKYYVWLVRSSQGISSRKSPADFDGDGRTDLAVYGTTDGAWLILPSSGGAPMSANWGGDFSDVPVAGDWNGSGAAKIGIFRQSIGTWFLDYNGNRAWDGSNIDSVIGWGGDGSDTPVVGDWNGSGTAKIGVFRRSTGTWFLDYNGNRAWDGPNIDSVVGWGGDASDMPVVGDWNGSGTAKIGVYRRSTGTWYLDLNGNRVWDGPGIDTVIGWGGDPNDTPVVGDYDGDGKADVAIWRPSNGYWYIINSFDQSVNYVQWGGEGDIPVPGDYDGDGKTDIAIYRPSNGYWYIIRSSDQGVVYIQWGGAPNDIPISQ